MPASSDFPRGQAFAIISATANIVLPAIANAAWVITDIEAIIFNTGAALFDCGVTVATTVSATNFGPFGFVAAQNMGGKDSWTWQGNQQCPVDESITIQLTNSAAGVTQILNVGAYLI